MDIIDVSKSLSVGPWKGGRYHKLLKFEDLKISYQGGIAKLRTIVFNLYVNERFYVFIDQREVA